MRSQRKKRLDEELQEFQSILQTAGVTWPSASKLTCPWDLQDWLQSCPIEFRSVMTSWLFAEGRDKQSGVGMRAITPSAIGIFHSLQFQGNGRCIFEPSLDLVRRLRCTQLNVPIGMIKMPFKSFAIRVPEGELWLKDTKGKDAHPLLMIYVTEYECEVPGSKLVPVIELLGTWADFRNKDDQLDWVKLRRDDPDKPVRQVLRDVLNLEERRKWDSAVEWKPGIGETPLSVPELETMLRETDSMALLALNLVVYVSQPGADVVSVPEQSDRIKQLKRELVRTKAPSRRRPREDELADLEERKFLVGTRVKFQPNEAKKYEQLLTGPRSQRKIHCKFVVMGHWHHYWVGKHGSEERHLVLRWVKPYVKGMEHDLEHESRTYEMEA